MNSRLALTVMLLVVVPTAVLSLVATQALRNRELIVQRRLETSADDAIRMVARRIDARLQDDLSAVNMALSECLKAGGEYREIRDCALRLESSRRCVGQVLLFMNPWGFVYPSSAPEDDSGPSAGVTLDPLVTALRSRLVAARDESGIAFTAGDQSYLFRRIESSRTLYAGFRIDAAVFKHTLQNAVLDASGEGIVLGARGPRLEILGGKEAGGSVLVSDPFTSSEGTERLDVETEPVSVGRLRPPFDYVTVSAFLADPHGLRETGRFRVRLYGWGIVLLACGIVGGAWVVIRTSSAEIRKARSRSEFVLGVSHDLRTPVSSMRMLAESLYLGHISDEAKQRKFLGTIVRECERLSQLIERVLFFVRFGQNALEFRLQDSDPGKLVAAAVEAFRARSEDLNGDSLIGGTKVSLHVQPDVPDVALDDSAMMQVLLNLLDNAQKYSRGVAEPIEVNVDAVRRKWKRFGAERPWVRISVRDRGIGIDPKHVKRVFQPFFRAPGASDGNVSGVGLGLALCRHIVSAHGGHIDVESRVGQGSTFSVYLPAARSEGDTTIG